MNNVYCWFDWDDNTTTVNTINIIKEPRKPWMEYEQGERVLAKLPQFGLWHGVIVEISESKKDLVQKMTSRQKNAAALELNENVQKTDKDSTELGIQKKTTRSKIATADTQNDDDDMNKDDKGKKKETIASKKRVREEDENKIEEKKKKKMEEAMKLDAKNRQLEDMILERRKTYTSTKETTEDDCQEFEATTILPLHSEIELVQDSPQTVQSTEPFWPGKQFGSPVSAFQPYSYFGDLMSPSGSSSATYHSLTSQTELQDKCSRLELENEQLKRENEQLRMQLERQGLDKQNEDVIATPKKVEFLRQLVTSFEKKTQKVRSQQAVTRVYSPTPVRLSTPVRLPVRLTYESTELNTRP